MTEKTFPSKTKARQWLASEMGIEERYCIIYDMDVTECETVVDICSTETNQKRKAS